jgi:hypothetical protein
MYYWSVSYIGRYLPSKVQPAIVRYLNTKEPSLRTAAVLVHSRKYYEKKPLSEELC